MEATHLFIHAGCRFAWAWASFFLPLFTDVGVVLYAVWDILTWPQRLGSVGAVAVAWGMVVTYRKGVRTYEATKASIRYGIDMTELARPVQPSGERLRHGFLVCYALWFSFFPPPRRPAATGQVSAVTVTSQMLSLDHNCHGLSTNRRRLISSRSNLYPSLVQPLSARGGGRLGPVLVCNTPQPPPPPGVLRDSSVGAMAPTAPKLFCACFPFIKPSMF